MLKYLWKILNWAIVGKVDKEKKKQILNSVVNYMQHVEITVKNDEATLRFRKEI
jgi:hypothetical protein